MFVIYPAYFSHLAGTQIDMLKFMIKYSKELWWLGIIMLSYDIRLSFGTLHVISDNPKY